jgi:hypothetical protein
MDWNLGVGGCGLEKKRLAESQLAFLHRGMYWDVQEGGKLYIHVRVHACISIDLDRVRARVVPKKKKKKILPCT